MKIHNEKMKLSVLAYAVQGALTLMFAMPLAAHADGDDAAKSVEAMRHPTNTIEVGVNAVSDKSAKFGEYNGLDKKGESIIGNFNVRGGDAYDNNTGTYRWDIGGKNLGTSNREIGGSVSNQGTWSIGIGYDELQHNTTTGYQTPYMGDNGGTLFTLPAAFGGVRPYTAPNDGGTRIGNATVNLVDGVLPTNLQNATLGLTPAQQALFHDINVNNTRKNTSFNAKVLLNPELKVTFDYNRLKQGGAKLQGFGPDGSLHNAAGTNVLAALNGAAGAALATAAGEKAEVVPVPTNYNTDTFNLGVHWAGENANLSASYYASFFRDNYKTASYQSYWIPATGSYSTPWTTGVTAANPALYTLGIDALTLPADNDLHQVNVMGGYSFSKATKLSGGFSYGRNTQNAPFIDSELTYRGRPSLILDPITQIGSANALVVTSHADLKLTNQTTSDLKLAAGFKYDKHNNRTVSNMYNFSSNNFAGVSPANEAIYPNTPLSTKKTQFELAADYRINAAQNVRLAYNREEVKRWCDSYAVSAAGGYPAVTMAQSLAAGGMGLTSAAAAGNSSKYPAGTNCVVAVSQNDDKLSADYRAQVNEDLNLRVGYAYSDRKTTSDSNARAAFMTVVPAANATLNNTVQGLNGGDALGFFPVFDASRTQNLLKGTVNWQANDQLNVSLNGRFGEDRYGDSTYGVKKGEQWSLSLDAGYAFSDSGSVTPFVTQQSRKRDMTNFGGNQAAAVTAVAATTTVQANGVTGALAGTNAVVGMAAGPWTWSNSLKDEDTTIGISVKQGDLMSGKLELMGDLTYSSGKTSYFTAYTNPVSALCFDPTIGNCGALPDITNKTTSLKLSGSYKLDKSSKIGFGYTYQKLVSNDFYYDGQQVGNTSNGTLPSNQKSGSYSVNVVAVAYVYSFK